MRSYLSQIRGWGRGRQGEQAAHEGASLPAQPASPKPPPHSARPPTLKSPTSLPGFTEETIRVPPLAFWAPRCKHEEAGVWDAGVAGVRQRAKGAGCLLGLLSETR